MSLPPQLPLTEHPPRLFHAFLLAIPISRYLFCPDAPGFVVVLFRLLLPLDTLDKQNSIGGERFSILGCYHATLRRLSVVANVERTTAVTSYCVWLYRARQAAVFVHEAASEDVAMK